MAARERLPRNQFANMWNDCLDAHPAGELLTAHIIKEELRDLCATAAAGGHRHGISHRLYRFNRWCADADIPETTTSPTPSRPGGWQSTRS